MPPTKELYRAYRAMNVFGYRSQTVKPVLKELLKLYDQNWELIKEENYKILLDAIMESEEHKGNKKKEQECIILDELKEDEPKRKLSRAYKVMEAFGYSQQTVKPVLENLLDVYEQNWQLIEDEQYRVLLDAILQNEEHKAEKKKQQKSHKSDEQEKDGPPGRRFSLRSREIESSPTSGDLSPSFNEAAKQPLPSRGKQKMTVSAHYGLEDNEIEAKIISPHKNDQNTAVVNSLNYYSAMELDEENIDESHPGSREIILRGDSDSDDSCSVIPMEVINEGTRILSWEEKNIEHKSHLSKQKNVLNKNYNDATNQTEQSPEDLSEFAAPLAVIIPGILFDGNSSKDSSSNSKEAFLASHEVIHLDAADKCSFYPCGEDISAGGGSCLERHHSESKSLVSAEEKTYSLDPSPLDIASSSNGEVTISLTHKSLHGLNICFPSLDQVSRRMEEDFPGSYRNRQSGFCVKKFMKDFCECFLAAGTITTGDKRVGPDFDAQKKLGSEDGLNGSINHEMRFCIAPDSSLEALKAQTLIDRVPEIPRLRGLNCLDFSRCKINLPLDGAYRENCFNLKALVNINPSSSMVIVEEQNVSDDMRKALVNINPSTSSSMVIVEEQNVSDDMRKALVNINPSTSSSMVIVEEQNASDNIRKALVNINPSTSSSMVIVEEQNVSDDMRKALVNINPSTSSSMVIVEEQNVSDDMRKALVNINPSTSSSMVIVEEQNASDNIRKALVNINPSTSSSMVIVEEQNVSDDMRKALVNINPSTSGMVIVEEQNASDDMRKALVNINPSSSMVIIEELNASDDMRSLTYYVEDITRGEEDLKVSLINEVNKECQPKFKYISRNISYQNAHLTFPLARISDDNCCSNCSGDCLSSEIPCACASETGGDFAYIPGALVKEKFLEDCISIYQSPEQENLFYCEDCPLERSKKKSLSRKCNGHLFRKFIKECWYKCGCGMQCGNRVVQRGITVKLQVFMTAEGKGWGLRTLEDLPKGAFVCEYVGEVVTNMELFERNMRNKGEKHTYPVLLDADWGTEGVLKDEEALCLDATFYGNVARFVNHRCDDANLIEIPVEVESPDHHYYHVAFFTTREVSASEELTWDYGIDFNDNAHPVEAFQCFCGSPSCRDIKPLKRRRRN